MNYGEWRELDDVRRLSRCRLIVHAVGWPSAAVFSAQASALYSIGISCFSMMWNVSTISVASSSRYCPK
jgi:hypothetical protein